MYSSFTKIYFLLFFFISFSTYFGQDTSKFNYYAVFDNILDTETNRVDPVKACLSGDGSTIFFYGRNIDTDTWGIYTIKSDGSQLTHIPWPANVEGVNYLTINYDGSRAFFTNYPGAHSWRYVVKVEGGGAAIIFDANGNENVNGCYTVRTTDDGEYVYFAEDRDGIWRMSYNGSGLQLVIDDAAAPVAAGTGAFCWDFDISSDGSKIAFILGGYYDPDWHESYQAFCWDGGFTRLTAGVEYSVRSIIRISGDGSKIVFNDAYPHSKWVTVDSDGSNYLHASVSGFNFGGIAIDSAGQNVFYYDQSANQGRMFSTDGETHLDLMPIWHPIFLSAVWNACMNDSGNKIMFTYRYNDVTRMMIGYLNTPHVPIDAPVIEDITFDPPSMPDDDPNARVNMYATVSDINGLDDIVKVSNDHILNGFQNGYSTELPIYFWADPRDDGQFPDATADDGIYTSRAEPGGAIDSVREVDMRVAFQDDAHNITVADATITVGPIQDVEDKNNVIPNSFELFQNYPNPFNPTTKIKFSIPKVETHGHASIQLKIYDVLGNEIATLVNEQKPLGTYEVEFDGTNYSSGIYFYTLRAGSFVDTKKLLLLK